VEYIFLVVGLLIAFTCIYCYRRGVKDGMAIKNGNLPELKKPEILKTPQEKEQDKADEDKRKQEQKLEKELMELFSFQPGHTAQKGADER
jgi:hypothetical protein